MRGAVNASLHGQLGPLSIGLGILYVLLAIAHLLALPGDIAPTMSMTAGLTAVAVGFLWLYVRGVPPERDRVNAVAAALVILSLANSLLHLYLTKEPRQTTNFLLIIVASGYMIPATRWFAGALVVSLATWLAAAMNLPASPEWVHYGFAVFQATLVGIGIHYLRVQMSNRTERMRLQEVWRRAELQEAKEHAEEMVRLKSAFLANMSHEIRTPLTGILGFAEIMRDETQGDLQTHVSIIQRNGQRLLETLNSVLDLARLEAGKMKLLAQAIDLNEAADSVMELFRPLAERNDLFLELEERNEDVWVAVDPSALLRILNNLVGNAIKFTRQGGVTVVVESGESEASIHVIDTGIGISAEFLPHLFEEFRQESTGMSRSHEGSGLGLSITRRLVELSGGVIEVESRPGEGSTFTVTLPLYLSGVHGPSSLYANRLRI